MIHVYSGKTSGPIYRQQLHDLYYTPDYEVTVRGRPTKELLNVVTEIKDPRARIQIVPGRWLNPWLALSESLWLLAGRNDVASLKPYNKRITDFSDDGETLYGAYGYRLKGQIEPLIKRLQNSDTDRRGVLEIWMFDQPDMLKEDLTIETNDPPCNTELMFKIRNEALHMTVVCRSNDLHWGLHAVNLIQFSILQEYLACRLGVAMGVQKHWSDSLHIYTDEQGQKITDRMLEAWYDPVEEIPSQAWLFPNPFPEGVDHKGFGLMCGAVLDGEYAKSVPEFPFLEFAEDFLRLYREPDTKEPLRHAKEFESWERMGIEWWEHSAKRTG